MVNIGTLRGFIELDDRGSAKLRTFESSLDRTATKFDNISGKLTSAGGKLTATITAPIVAIGAVAIKSGNEFIKTMNTVAAVTDASGADFKRLEAAAVEWGQKTSFSAKDAADAMLQLGKAGFTTDQTISALPSTLQLAAAANMSLGDAANLTANVMKTFGLQVTDLAAANDILAKAANSSTIDVADLRESLKYVGPIAHQAGAGLAETSAAMAIMGEAGIKGSMAGTSLRNAMTSLMNPTKAEAELMQQLGLSSAYSNGKLMDMATVVDTLRAKSADTAEIMALFGDRAGPAMATLVAKGGDALRELTKQLENSEGAAKRMEEAAMQGLPGAFERMRGGIETAATALLRALEPSLTRVADGIARLSEFIANTLVPAFMAMPQWLQTASLALVAAAAAVGPFLLALGGIVSTAGLAMKGLALLQAAAFTLGNTVPILTARLWLMDTAAKAVSASSTLMAGSLGLVVKGGAVAGLFVALGAALVQVGKAFKDLYATWQAGGSMWEFFTKKDDDTFLRRWLGLSGAVNKVGKDIHLATQELKVYGPAEETAGEKADRLAKSQTRVSEAAQKAAEQLRETRAALAPLEMVLPGIDKGFGLVSDEIDKLNHRFEVSIPRIQEFERQWHALSFGMVSVGDSLDEVGVKAEALTQLQKDNYFVQLGPTVNEAEKRLRSFGEFLTTELGPTILKAFQGGGDVGKSIGAAIGGFLTGPDSEIGKKIGDWASDLGGMLGSTLGSVIPVVGTMLGGVVGSVFGKIGKGIGKLFGIDKEVERVNDLRDAYEDSFGPNGIGGTLHDMNAAFHNVGLTLDRVLSAKKVEDFEAAMEEFNQKLQFQTEQMEFLDATVQKYGFSIEELGPKFAAQKLDEQAALLIKEFSALEAAQIDVNTISGKMSESINAYIANAMKAGVAVPESMRPILQHLVDMGLLTDQNGKLITDLETSGITFSQTMSEQFKELISTIKEMTDAIGRGLGIAVEDTSKKISKDLNGAIDESMRKIKGFPKHIPIQIDYHDGGMPRLPSGSIPISPGRAHDGALVTWSGLKRFHRGVAGLGRDEVPAILQVGESVLNARATAAVGVDTIRALNTGMAGTASVANGGASAGGGSDIVIPVHLIADGREIAAVTERVHSRDVWHRTLQRAS